MASSTCNTRVGRRRKAYYVYWRSCLSFIHSFIHSDHFYSASSSPLLLRSAPDTARVLCRSFTPKRHRQLWVENLPKVPTWRLERESNPRPSGWKLSTQPIMRHHIPRPYPWRLTYVIEFCLYTSVTVASTWTQANLKTTMPSLTLWQPGQLAIVTVTHWIRSEGPLRSLFLKSQNTTVR